MEHASLRFTSREKGREREAQIQTYVECLCKQSALDTYHLITIITFTQILRESVVNCERCLTWKIMTPDSTSVDISADIRFLLFIWNVGVTRPWEIYGYIAVNIFRLFWIHRMRLVMRVYECSTQQQSHTHPYIHTVKRICIQKLNVLDGKFSWTSVNYKLNDSTNNDAVISKETKEKTMIISFSSTFESVVHKIGLYSTLNLWVKVHNFKQSTFINEFS